jgi:hypothetical protein
VIAWRAVASGGMNDNDVYDDVFYLDLASSSWKQAQVE